MGEGATSTGLAPTSNPSADPTPTVERDLRDPVEKWVDENPNFDATVASTPDAAPSTPVAETSTAPAPAAHTAPEAKAAPEAPSTTSPATGSDTPAAVAVASTPSPEPARPTFSPMDDVPLADGVTWKRAEVVAALEERARILPLVAEAEGYKQIFGMTAEQAKAAWAPIVQRLGAEPQTVAFFDQYLANPQLASYLQDCTAEFNRVMGTSPQNLPQTIPSQPAPEVKQLSADVAALKKHYEEQELRANMERVNREMAQVTARYPFIATDKNVRDDLLQTAKWLHQQDPSKGILDALALKASLYDAAQRARNEQVTPTTAPPPQPVLLGTTGAAPTASRPQPDGRPKKFASLDDAVDDWVSSTTESK